MHRNKFLYNKTNQMHQFPEFTPAWNSTCFGQFFCPSSGVYLLYTRHWYMSYRFVDSRTRMELLSILVLLESCLQTCRHIPVPSVQWINSWRWAEELPKTCRVSCRSKFGKLVYLVGFIINKYLLNFGILYLKFSIFFTNIFLLHLLNIRFANYCHSFV